MKSCRVESCREALLEIDSNLKSGVQSIIIKLWNLRSYSCRAQNYEIFRTKPRTILPKMIEPNQEPNFRTILIYVNIVHGWRKIEGGCARLKISLLACLPSPFAPILCVEVEDVSVRPAVHLCQLILLAWTDQGAALIQRAWLGCPAAAAPALSFEPRLRMSPPRERSRS